jgi:tetratricopeptide (TPR) repeat protein
MSVAFMLLVLSGGIGVALWQQQRADAARRDGERRQAVEFALDKATGLRDQLHFREAATLLEQGRKALGDGGPDDLRQRLDVAAADVALANRLDTIRQRRATWIKGRFDTATAAREYARAFREAGLGEVGDDERAVAARIKATGVSGPLVAALDDWAFVEQEPRSTTWLLAVARDADPSPSRDRIRDPAVWRFHQKLQELVDEILQDSGAALAELSPQMLESLAWRLRGGAAAVPLLRAAQRRHPSDFWLNLALSHALWDAAQVGEAVGYARVAVALRPGASAAHNNLGASLHAKNDLEEAIAEYRKAIDLDPKHSMAHVNLGNALRYKKDYEGALAEYQKAIEFDPKYASAHAALGDVLYEKKDLDGAIAEFRKAIELDRRDALAHYSLGLALRDKKDLDGAIAEFHKAIELEPNDADLHNNLGVALRENGNLDEAIAEYKKAIDIDPNLTSAHSNLGAGLHDKQDLVGAITAFRRAIAIEPKLASAHFGLGRALRATRDLDGAILAYRQAIALAPDYAEAHCNLGGMLKQQGHFAESLAAYKRGHELGTKRPGWPYPSAEWVREAENLAAMEGKLPAFLRGEFQPKDAAECLGLAGVCHGKQLLHASARLYADAFAIDHKLADDMRAGHRYNAACYAALAAAGQGEDTAKLDEKERTRLRQQARDWLRADLALRGKQLESGQPADRAAVQQALRHWHQDSDLVVIRDAAALAELAAEERAACEQLWADVAALLKKAEAPATEGKP